MANRYTVKQLVEKGVKQRFTNNENWQDPQFLRDTFSKDQLLDAVGVIVRFRKAAQSGGGVYEEEATAAKELLNQAYKLEKSESGAIKESSGQQQQDDKQKWDSQDNPESFYQRLKQERALRDSFTKGNER